MRNTNDPTVEQAALTVLRGGQYLMGATLETFEARLAEYQNIPHVFGVANGTDALALSMLALGIETDDRVITVPNAGGYASFAARMIGAIPVLVDVDPVTQQMDPLSLQAALKSTKPKAIILTHLYGLAADTAEILKIAGDIPVIEDVAQAMGTRTGTTKAGSNGTIAAFSFYPTKNLGACGDAGAVCTQDATLANRIRALRQYGWAEKYHATFPYGRNSRMDNIQAAILTAKMSKLDVQNQERRGIWKRYKTATGNALQFIGRDDDGFTAHLCVVKADARDAWEKMLAAKGIATTIHYPVMDHEQKALQGIIETPVPLPNATHSKNMILTLPCFSGMTEDEIAYVCQALKEGIA
ncbi:MAG TPA: DegT/DnrJ/EryC1/StrS family aminotransferase [Alphaproteobacteria bacterium]